jgi:hypothetical protein
LAHIENVERPVYEQVDEQVDNGSTPIMVLGLEHLSRPGDDQVGMVQNLNITRPLWKERFQRPVVFWLTRESERLVTQYAPDFYRFRSASIDFPFPDPPSRRRTWELRRRIERVQASPETKMRWWWEHALRVGGYSFSMAATIACVNCLRLPSEGASRVEFVGLYGRIATLAPLADLPNLRSLFLSDDLDLEHKSKLTPRALAELPEIKKVRDLILYFTGRVDAELLRVIATMDNIRTLHLGGQPSYQGTDGSQARSVREVVSSALLEEEDFKTIRSMNGLRGLTVTGCTLSALGLRQISSLRLSGIQLSDRSVTDDCLERLPDGLQSLHLTESGVTDGGLSCLSRLRQLKRLDVAHTGITGIGLRDLAPLDELRCVTLDQSALDDDGAAALPALKQLSGLDIQHTAVTDAAVDHLSQCGSLRRLYLFGSRISLQGVDRLREMLPRCKVTQARRDRPLWSP